MYYMGQYRHSGEEKCFTDVETTKEYYATTTKYRDVILIPSNETIEQGETYHLSLQLAKNAIFDTTYNIKMIRKNDEKNYELIDTITLKADENGVDNYTTVYLVRNDTDNSGPIIQTKKPQDGAVYNYAIIPHSWEAIEMTGSNYYPFDIIFSSHYSKAAFDCILIEIQRSSVDDNITNYDGDFMFYGRYLDLDEDTPDIKATLKKVNQLLPGKNDKDVVIKKIGVWGRPELPLVINGEEVKIGPSGCFELEGYDIKSFGVCASENDKFIVDYQYTKE